MSVAHTIREHRPAVARTLRETFGVGLSDLGDALTWGEAKILLEEAAEDQSTTFGAKLADWSYPATVPVLLSLVASVGDKRAARDIMPWVLTLTPDGPQATPDEIAAADAALEEEIVFQ